jgi:hypothetical protein
LLFRLWILVILLPWKRWRMVLGWTFDLFIFLPNWEKCQTPLPLLFTYHSQNPTSLCVTFPIPFCVFEPGLILLFFFLFVFLFSRGGLSLIWYNL